MEIGAGLDAIAHQLCRGCNFGVRTRFAFERLLGLQCAIRIATDAGYSDAGQRDFAGIASNAGGNADNGEAAGRLQKLLVTGPGEPGFYRDDHFGHQFAWLERGCESVDEEVGGGQGAGSRGGGQYDLLARAWRVAG